MSAPTDNERSEAGSSRAASCSAFLDEDGIILINGDCIEILPQLPPADAVVTDPPYNVGLDYGESVDDRKENYREWCETWAGLLHADRKAISCGLANMTMWQDMMPPDWWICWHKPAAMGRCFTGFNNWEPIALWGKPLKQTSDVITATIKPDPSLEGHPCPKPLDWAKKQIEMLVPEGGLVIDPFAGSGTVLVAARELGRRAIGIEMNPEFCEIAKRRLSQRFLF